MPQGGGQYPLTPPVSKYIDNAEYLVYACPKILLFSVHSTAWKCIMLPFATKTNFIFIMGIIHVSCVQNIGLGNWRRDNFWAHLSSDLGKSCAVHFPEENVYI